MIDENTTTSLFDSTQTLREIRSHRRPRRVRVPRRLIVATAAVLAVAASFSLSGSSEVPPAHAAAPLAVQPAIAPMPERGSAVSRSMVRETKIQTSRARRINKVISYAMAQRGDRYHFGAAGPNKWDCSGLAMVSYRKIGVKLPHFTGAMLRHGKHISRKHLQRGDLIFPSNHHVGIYIGGGKMIVASSGHGKVMVQKVYAFYAARRII
ncbi:MAG TPA: C40 family peptidase [Candidatus Eisenbacteria bacterium]|nr:C40 family peptidase [Candidatus Eisenbacteria bacterium]